MTISRCERLFEQSLHTEFTRRDYRLGLKYYREFVGVDTAEELLQGDQMAIQERVEDYLFYLKGKISPNSIGTRLAPVYLFYAVNDVILNKTKIKKMQPPKVKVQGFNAYTREDIVDMLNNTRKKRSKAVIHVLASTGCRVGGLVGLRIRDISDMPNQCKCLRFYAGDKHEYYGFLTPEASKALYHYFEERKSTGETLTDEKPIFAINEKYDRTNGAPYRPITTASVFGIVRGTLSGKKRRKEEGGRYEIPTLHGVRKYYNKTLKMRDNCNISICEKLIDHSTTIPLDNVYLPIGKEELFVEFEKAVPDLTIREDERRLLRINDLEKQNKAHQDKERENESLKEELEILKLRMQRMELSKEI